VLNIFSERGERTVDSGRIRIRCRGGSGAAAHTGRKVAAKHHRIEAERKVLQEALTDAQLVLSLQQRKPLAEVRSLKVPQKSEVSEASRRGKARGVPKG
jgi:hypothetical protein